MRPASSFCLTGGIGPRIRLHPVRSEWGYLNREQISLKEDSENGQSCANPMARNRDRGEVGGDVSSNVHTAFSKNDWHLDLVHDLPSQSLQADPSIDDPVNDTRLGSPCGDLQVSGEFAR
jgi:hypothetical protein